MRNGMNGLGCGRRGGSGMLATVGVALIAAGLILLFACIPGWAWAALAGLALIVAGYVLIRLEAGR